MKTMLFISILLTTTVLLGQKQGNIWYFGGDIFNPSGFGAGLDFNGPEPVVLTNSAMSHTEGCASYCNSAGQLLFYTNGETVYDKTHTMMDNGDSLGGNISTQQSCLIVPFVNDSTKYYIFTNDGVNTSQGTGLKYSIIDLKLNSGLGSVMTKGIPLLSHTSEQLAGLVHSNGSEFWVLTTEHDSGIFYAYKVNDSGIDPPVISDAGFNFPLEVSRIKVSPTYTKIATKQYENMYLLDFDNSTGLVSNKLIIHTSSAAIDGFCFSPDGNLFYEKAADDLILFSDSLYQYNLNAPDIAASRLAIANLVWPDPWGINYYLTMDMQIGPNGKIYMNQTCFTCLDVIHNPNVLGPGCNFEQNNIDLAGRYSGIIFPNTLMLGKVPEPDPLVPESSVSPINIFTPNNDQVNDVFTLNPTNFTHFNYTIFNRWGEIMFEGDLKNNSWDGYLNHKPASDGVYFYRYTGLGINKTEKQGHGFFHLLK